MPFNLIADRWIPCRRHDGSRVWLSPGEITSDFADNPALALDFPRPDWNAAVTELLIGLVTVAMPPEGTSDWAKLWIEPPSVEMLTNALAPLVFAFDLDGDGPRAFQDISPLENEKQNGVGALIIDAPGENTTEKNADHFIKRDGNRLLSLPYAAAAVVTMQTYAPAGGAGNRTSMRGGGPLTVLLAPHRKHRDGVVNTLWDLVWSNVLDRGAVGEPLDLALPRDDRRWPRIFPWLAETRTSENDQPTLPEDHADPLQCFFGLPRRIRLDIADGGTCDLGGPVEWGSVATYRATNYGLMYSGWQHPLSPYYDSKDEGKLPFHPQPGITTYADWLAWWGLRDKGTSPSRNVAVWNDRLRALQRSSATDVKATRQRGLWAVGFDMDSMKARGFLDERIPYYEPEDAPGWAKKFQQTVAALVAGAKTVASRLQHELRRSRFAKRSDKGDGIELPKKAPKEAFKSHAAALWRETEPAFRDTLEKLHDGDPADASMELRRAFHGTLRTTALRLFDAASNIDTLADQDAKRIVVARRALFIALSGNGKVAKALGIIEAKPAKSGKGTGKKAGSKT